MDLEAKGQIIPEIDHWIAAVALECEMPLATRDALFDRVDGLSVSTAMRGWPGLTGL